MFIIYFVRKITVFFPSNRAALFCIQSMAQYFQKLLRQKFEFDLRCKFTELK